jgi:hypothetical protein
MNMSIADIVDTIKTVVADIKELKRDVATLKRIITAVHTALEDPADHPATGSEQEAAHQ